MPVRSSHSSHNFSDQLVQIVGCEAYPYCQVIVTILHIYYFLVCDVPLERKAFTVGESQNIVRTACRVGASGATFPALVASRSKESVFFSSNCILPFTVVRKGYTLTILSE